MRRGIDYLSSFYGVHLFLIEISARDILHYACPFLAKAPCRPINGRYAWYLEPLTLGVIGYVDRGLIGVSLIALSMKNGKNTARPISLATAVFLPLLRSKPVTKPFYNSYQQPNWPVLIWSPNIQNHRGETRYCIGTESRHRNEVGKVFFRDCS